MPSKRKQFNVRLPDETMAKIDEVMKRMHQSLNIDISRADVIVAAIAELEKRYPPMKKGKGTA